MLQYILSGLALGAIYAIASSSLVVTFVSAGILNFAFGSMAYVIARIYYWLNSQQGWPTDVAGAVSLLVVAPLVGILLYFLLFRFLSGKSTLVKMVATIGLSVALPPVTDLVFGTQTITSAPGLASLSDPPYHFLGTPVTTNQVITYGFLLFVLVAGTGILRFTDVGLRVRAMVDSEAMASLSGSNPSRVALGVWAMSAMLAGVAGILVAPTNGLTTTGMTELMAAAFAAVVAARLRSLPGAIAVSLAMGVVTDVIQKYLPANSSFTAAIIPSIPFGFILVFLIIYLVRSGSLRESGDEGGPLDAAIRPANADGGGAARAAVGGRQGAVTGVVFVALLALLPLLFHGSGYWLGLVALGVSYAITFLTFTLVTGEGGMLWLSQIIFAGVGALATAQFVVELHVPVLVAVVLAGVVAAAAGAIIGVLTIRLGDLYVALVTLTFGLLVETLVFTMSRFLQGGVGVPVNRPSFATSDMTFSYLGIGVFLVLALLIVNLRRSTSGMALRAVRDSESASRTIGLSVLQVKVITGALAAFVAAVGGGFLAMDAGVAQPQSYATFLGLIWLAVVVTLGARSIIGAALAGLSFSLLPGVFSTYLPTRWAEVPSILFGLGAISVARNPEGAVAQNAAQIRALLSRRRPRPRGGAGQAGQPAGPAVVVEHPGAESLYHPTNSTVTTKALP
ncbi:ABC transporter permease [Acidiferrimicrobium sp. IK]|uniref:ABC transporter permease n=1 Tax=Acidiferrimicrobium sp. IK TaxID=2871700 RepID=UPI0021CB3A44|nr:ABC transporter permease [Acidiferrimicrobium sp. IK]MCU4182917.1 ABC transporter permease [Acidiferrimicrobium sp. IK]